MCLQIFKPQFFILKYQPGDDIIILLTKEEGKVIEIIDKKMLLVEVNGVQFPAYIDQVDFPYFQRFSQKKIFENTKPAKKYIDDLPKEKLENFLPPKAEGVWLSLIPKFSFDEFSDEVVDYFKIYLINKNDSNYTFKYEQLFAGKIFFELPAQINAHHDFYLHDISFEALNDSPSFVFEFSLTNTDKSKAEYYEALLKLQGKKVFKQVEEMKLKNEPSLMYKLFDNYPDAIKEHLPYYDKHQNIKSSSNKPAIAPRSVVDLHIEKLIDDYSGLSNFEILTIQLKEFEKWYDITLKHNLPNLVVIHGIGTGKLKEEIHEILKTKHKVKTFINQYHPRFGYGATEIFFQY